MSVLALPFRPTYAAAMCDVVPSGQFGFLAELSQESEALVARTVRRIACPGGTRLVMRGDKVSSVYLVTRGALRVFYLHADGREGTLYWVEAGQSCILALNCVFSHVAYPAWVEADGEAEVTVIPGDTYRQLFAHEKSVQGFTFETLSSRLFELMAMVEETSSQGLEARIAGFLLRRAASGPVLSLTQDQIARHLSTSREVVSRVLRRLVAQGLIATAPAQIELRDPKGLAQLLEG